VLSGTGTDSRSAHVASGDGLRQAGAGRKHRVGISHEEQQGIGPGGGRVAAAPSPAVLQRADSSIVFTHPSRSGREHANDGALWKRRMTGRPGDLTVCIATTNFASPRPGQAFELDAKTSPIRSRVARNRRRTLPGPSGRPGLRSRLGGAGRASTLSSPSCASRAPWAGDFRGAVNRASWPMASGTRSMNRRRFRSPGCCGGRGRGAAASNDCPVARDVARTLERGQPVQADHASLCLGHRIGAPAHPWHADSQRLWKISSATARPGTLRFAVNTAPRNRVVTGARRKLILPPLQSELLDQIVGVTCERHRHTAAPKTGCPAHP